MTFPYLLLVLTLVVSFGSLAACIGTLFKLRQFQSRVMIADARIESLLRTEFSQVEALLCLYRDLQLDRGLPPTRGWAASPDFLRSIREEVAWIKPQLVVECGSGVSTIVLARCMQMIGAGRVLALEHDPAFASATRKSLQRFGLLEFATVIDAPLVDYTLDGEVWPWYRIDALPAGMIDMIVVDGPPYWVRAHARYPVGPLLFPRLARSSSVFLDDFSREEETEIVRRWCERDASLELARVNTEKGLAILRKGHAP